MKTTLSSTGQIEIPVEIRRKLGLPEGVILECRIEDGRIILDPNPQSESAKLLETGTERPVLIAPSGAPEMNPELVKEILAAS